MAIFSKAILEGRALTVNGDGEQTRDYLCVTDVVRANLLATVATLDRRVPILNIGTGVETSVNDIVRLLGDILGSEVRRQLGPARPGEQQRSALNAALAKRVLGWEPTTSLRAGLAETFRWFQAKFVR